MAVEEHGRFKIWSEWQHPLRHTLSDFSYSAKCFGGQVTTINGALDWILAVLYPNVKDSVATTAALPAVGNSELDYRVVLDDGDGKAAGYRWEKREGEAVATWHKIYDMDWGEQSVLSNFLSKTNDVYTYKYGIDDLDGTGTPLAGVESGQHLFGGASASTHLTLHANSGDALGAQTGYIQIADNFRPTIDSQWSLGTTTERFLKIWSDEITVGTLTATGGSITDSSGAISFGDENLTTTGVITGNSAKFVSSVEVGALLGDALILAPGSITDESGAISFGDDNLTTTGAITSNSAKVVTSIEVGALAGNALILAPGSITDESGAINFGDENLATTGNIQAATGYLLTSLEIGPLAGNALILSPGSITDESGDISFGNENLLTTGTLGAGATTVTSCKAGDLTIALNAITAGTLNAGITLTPNGNGLVEIGGGLFPTTDSALDIGKTGKVWNKLWIDGYIGDGTNEIAISTLLSFRSALSGALTGDTLFYNAISGCWEASHPDSEIDHGSLTGISDDDHTQYALLAGRAGGQTLVGGTLASQSLTLSSTAHGTKGYVLFSDILGPVTTAAYSGGWAGTDIGDATHCFKDVYTKGVFNGLRLENNTYANIPAASAQNAGRLWYASDTKKVYIDTGGSWAVAGATKWQNDEVFDGTELFRTITVSSVITDARQAIWQVRDNANDYEVVNCSIKTTQTTVTVSGEVALPAGTYRVIGIEV